VSINQKERPRDEMHLHSISVQSLMASVVE